MNSLSFRKSYILLLVILLLLTAVFSSLSCFVSTYFLGQKAIHLTASILVISSAWFAGYYISGKFLTVSVYRITVLTTLMIIEVPAVYLYYFIRPYTLYYSVIVFLNLFLFGILSGVLSSLIIRLRINNRESLPASSIIMCMLLTFVPVHLLPVQKIITVLPYISGLGFLAVISWQLVASNRKILPMLIPVVILTLEMALTPFYPDFRIYTRQKEFEDKVVYTASSPNFNITITQWMDDYWLYLDKLKNISTIDEYLYYEPFAHTAAQLTRPEKVLIIGGENGCLLRELLHYETIHEFVVLPYDTTLLRVCRTYPAIKKVNRDSFSDNRVRIATGPVLGYITDLKESVDNPDDSSAAFEKKFDLIAVDLPDPRSLEMNQYYTEKFYRYLKEVLRKDGIMITQAGSPYFATKAFLSIQKTIQSAGFYTLPIHNQILTLGEWGWVIGSVETPGNKLKKILLQSDFSGINTHWLNKEALLLLTSFGKDYIKTDSIAINTLENPVVYKYYLEGNWELE